MKLITRATRHNAQCWSLGLRHSFYTHSPMAQIRTLVQGIDGDYFDPADIDPDYNLEKDEFDIMMMENELFGDDWLD